MKFFNNRVNLIISGLGLIAIIASTAFYFQSSANAAKAEIPVVQTAKVRKGDMVIIASGAGVAEPAAQIDLAFRSAGTLTELNVNVGDQVKSAQVLARLEENIQAEADFQALFNAQGIANTELALANAHADLDDAVGTYAYLIGTDAWYWQRQLETAEAAINALDATAAISEKEDAQELVDDAIARRDYFLSLRTDVSDVDMTSARKPRIRESQFAGCTDRVGYCQRGTICFGFTIGSDWHTNFQAGTSAACS